MGLPVVHFEIGCRNRGFVANFYSQLFGWKITDSMIDTAADRGINGHLMSFEPYRNWTMIYVQVDEFEPHLERVRALGGRVISPVVKLPAGSFVWIEDPEENSLGLWRPWKDDENLPDPARSA